MVEDCELCGRQTRDIFVIDVENVEMRTCASCAKGKKVIRTEFERTQQKQGNRPAKVRPLSDEERPLVDDYAHRIKQARENMKIPLKVLAEKLNEKEGYLSRVEEGKTEPNNVLVKKLEREFQIKLTEDAVEEAPIKVSKKPDKATLGEFADTN